MQATAADHSTVPTLTWGLHCPHCEHDLKLRRLVTRQQPVNRFPAIRPCPECSASVLIRNPRWAIPVLILAITAVVIVALVGVESLGLFEGGRLRDRPVATAAGLASMVAVVPMLYGWMRLTMSLHAPTRDDEQLYGSN